jgi:hypothetical protein
MRQRRWLVGLLGFAWATLTGTFFALPTLSPLVGMAGLAIALLYAAMVCGFQRRAMVVAMGMTVGIAVSIPSPETLLVNLIVALALCLNWWLFAELGIELLQRMSQRQAYLRLAAVFAGPLAIGWAAAVGFS